MENIYKNSEWYEYYLCNIIDLSPPSSPLQPRLNGPALIEAMMTGPYLIKHKHYHRLVSSDNRGQEALLTCNLYTTSRR